MLQVQSPVGARTGGNRWMFPLPYKTENKSSKQLFYRKPTQSTHVSTLIRKKSEYICLISYLRPPLTLLSQITSPLLLPVISSSVSPLLLRKAEAREM